jgi:hypothetical protein
VLMIGNPGEESDRMLKSSARLYPRAPWPWVKIFKIPILG